MHYFFIFTLTPAGKHSNTTHYHIINALSQHDATIALSQCIELSLYDTELLHYHNYITTHDYGTTLTHYHNLNALLQHNALSHHIITSRHRTTTASKRTITVHHYALLYHTMHYHIITVQHRTKTASRRTITHYHNTMHYRISHHNTEPLHYHN